MNKYVKMMMFVGILGTVSGGLLFGTGALTNSLIDANADALLKSEVLTAHGVEFNFTNIHDVFAGSTNSIEIEGQYTKQNGDIVDYTYTFYQDKINGTLTFGFGPTFGGGVWGPIIGLLSLESDLTTIVRISVLQQEETPGLGGIVATRAYLDTFVGKTIGLGDEAIVIIKDLDVLVAASNQVRSITGATRTSTSFNTILNEAYAAHRAVWEAR
jgi:Na+-transporting NADH:ubiquinone oxidoreductase subunit C